MGADAEFVRAREEYEKYWRPVEALFQAAATRGDILEACRRAQEVTGRKYCFGIGYYGEPKAEEAHDFRFHGWLHDEGQDMITVWYTHGAAGRA